MGTPISWRDEQALSNLVGEAPAFVAAIADLRSIAQSDAPVLIGGETGCGKELVARGIHYLGRRAGFPFVPVNCGSFPETLLEAELFGHERGAFTDAQSRRDGLIKEAEGGTLFLDEVDTLPPKAQVDLLRVLQDKSFRAIGSSVVQHADVQFVAASNARLEDLVKMARFRTDLYYRLAVFSIHLPPLRDRKSDVLLLAHHFLRKHAVREKEGLRLSPGACTALMAHNWPGNVRELENAIIRGIHLSRDNTIEVQDLHLEQRQDSGPVFMPVSPQVRPLRILKRELVEAFERNYLTRLLADHRGNVSEAARVAGKERRDLGRLLKKHGLNPKLFRSPEVA